MKKFLIKAICFVGIGFLLGEYLFGDAKTIMNRFHKEEPYYFLLEGMYSNSDTMQKDIQSLSNKIIEYQNQKYYVYVGITKDKEVAEILKNIYLKRNIKVYIKEKELTSEEFSVNVNQFDLLIKDTEDEDQILTIEKVVLANYEEILKNK